MRAGGRSAAGVAVTAAVPAPLGPPVRRELLAPGVPAVPTPCCPPFPYPMFPPPVRTPLCRGVPRPHVLYSPVSPFPFPIRPPIAVPGPCRAALPAVLLRPVALLLVTRLRVGTRGAEPTLRVPVEDLGSEGLPSPF